MNTNYPTSNFDYNTDFKYNFNIFNNNNIGIGTINPLHKLHIHGNMSTTNLTVDNIICPKLYLNHINVLEYNINSNKITPLKLMSQENTFNTNKYQWSQTNNNLSLQFFNKRDNTPILYQSNEYKITTGTNNNKINIYSKYELSITHLYLYKKNNNNQTFNITASGGKFFINSISQNTLSLSPNNIYIFNLNDSSLNNHPFLLSATNNGTHNSGTIYTTNIVFKLDNTTVTSNTYLTDFSTSTQRSITFTPTQDITLYYYCHVHSNMGSSITVSSSQIENISNSDLLNLTINSISIQKLSTNYYKLNSPINLTKNTSNLFTFSNETPPYYIILLGQYTFNNSLLWNTNISTLPNNVYIFNKIGIGTSNITKNLHINDSAKISHNITVQKNITTTNSNIINNINTTNTQINTLESNKLIINSKQKNVGIGTTYSNEFFNVSNDFIINSNNNTFFNKNSNVNSIYLQSNINSVSYNNNNILIFNNTNNNHNLFLKDIHISKPYQTSTKTSQSFIHFKNNVNIFNETQSNEALYINGNALVSGNINVSDKLIINTISSLHLKNANVVNLKNTQHTFSKNLIYSNHLHTKDTTTKYITIPKKNNTNSITKGELIYNTTDNKLYGRNSSGVIILNSSIKNEFNYDFNGVSDLLYTQTKDISSKKTNITKKFILPKKHTTSNSNINIGAIQYNTNSLYTEIFNGKFWSSIKYNNTDSELQHLSFDDSTLLTPHFNSRLFNYSYNNLQPPLFMNISFNPYTTNTYHFRYNTTTFFSKTVTTTDYTFEHIDMTQLTNANNVIITSSNSQNDSLTYQCNFTFESPVRDFLVKYNSFKIIHKSNTINDYIIKPFLTNEYSKLNLSSIQSNFQKDLVLTPDNKIYYEYSGDTKFNALKTLFTKNDLINSYYNRTTKKIYLGEPIKHYQTELQFINNKITSGYYSPNYIPVIINKEPYENELISSFYDPEQDKIFISPNFELTSVNDTILYTIEDGITCKLKFFNS